MVIQDTGIYTNLKNDLISIFARYQFRRQDDTLTGQFVEAEVEDTRGRQSQRQGERDLDSEPVPVIISGKLFRFIPEITKIYFPRTSSFTSRIWTRKRAG